MKTLTHSHPHHLSSYWPNGGKKSQSSLKTKDRMQEIKLLTSHLSNGGKKSGSSPRTKHKMDRNKSRISAQSQAHQRSHPPSDSNKPLYQSSVLPREPDADSVVLKQENEMHLVGTKGAYRRPSWARG